MEIWSLGLQHLVSILILDEQLFPSLIYWELCIGLFLMLQMGLNQMKMHCISFGF